MKSVTAWHFSHKYLQEFLVYEPFCIENWLIYLHFYLRRVSAYNIIYKSATSVIQEFMDVCAKYLN